MYGAHSNGTPLPQVLNVEQQELAHKNEYNFDHPDAFDFDLLCETLRKLKEGKRVEVPIYNFVTHAREKLTVSGTFLLATFPWLSNGLVFHRKQCTVPM